MFGTDEPFRSGKTRMRERSALRLLTVDPGRQSAGLARLRYSSQLGSWLLRPDDSARIGALSSGRPENSDEGKVSCAKRVNT
jgi:hypothetical protein